MTLKINALLAPYDSGFRGARMGAGPVRLVEAGIFDEVKSNEVRIAVAEFVSQGDRLRGEVASALEIQQWLSLRVGEARSKAAFPIVLSGNCATSVGTFAGLLSRSRQTPAVCWFDAHADFNTPETTQSGFLGGMSMAMLTGHCWTHLLKSVRNFRPAPESAVLMLGTRSVDALERKRLLASEIRWPKTRHDAALYFAELSALRKKHGEVYLHIDLDVLDESEGRANSYACKGGLSRSELVELVRGIGARFHIGAAALTAYDPTCDPLGRIPPIARELVNVIVQSLTSRGTATLSSPRP